MYVAKRAVILHKNHTINTAETVPYRDSFATARGRQRELMYTIIIHTITESVILLIIIMQTTIAPNA